MSSIWREDGAKVVDDGFERESSDDLYFEG